MQNTGFGRPGALLIVAAVVLAILFGIGPMWMAMTSPTHAFVATGAKAFWLDAVGFIIILLYVVGCILYTRSKSYSGWIGFWLCLGNLPGFIAMLLLPDLYAMKAAAGDRETRRETAAPAV